MKKCPSWKANIFSARQGINCILWDPKVHNRVHNIPPHVHTLSQLNPAHALKIDIFKINFNIIPHLRLTFHVISFLQVFPPNPCTHLSSPPPHTCYMFRPFHPSWADRPHSIQQRAQIVKTLAVQFAPVSCYFVTFRPKYLRQNPVLEDPLPQFLFQCDRPSFTPAHNTVNQ